MKVLMQTALSEAEKTLNAKGIDIEIIQLGHNNIVVVIGSPIYDVLTNGTLIPFINCLFYSKLYDKSLKVVVTVVNCCRGEQV